MWYSWVCLGVPLKWGEDNATVKNHMALLFRKKEKLGGGNKQVTCLGGCRGRYVSMTTPVEESVCIQRDRTVGN